MNFEYLNNKKCATPRYNEAIHTEDIDGNDIIIVRTDTEQGYYDMDGNYTPLSRACYDLDFKYGVAVVKEGNKYGYVNLNGKIIVPPQYLYATKYANNGLALVSQKADDNDYNRKIGFIDLSGKVVIEPRFSAGFGFCEGLAAVEVVVNGKYKWGFIDKTGAFVIEPVYDHAAVFCGGIANVNLGRKSIYIDKKGNIVEPIFGKYEHRFYNNLMLIQTNHRYGYVDRSNQIAISPQFTAATSFSEGLAGVKKKGEKYGFIDIAGNYVVEPKFDNVGCFSNGLCVIKKGKKYGYIDKSGNIVIKPTFEQALRFENNGLAIVKKDGKCGLIDNKGDWVVSPEFDRIWPYENICLVRIGDKFDVIRLIK